MTDTNKPLLQQHTCSWSQGCTQPALDRRSYCEDHVWQVYQKGTALGRRNRDAERAARIHLLNSLINEAVQELEDEGVL